MSSCPAATSTWLALTPRDTLAIRDGRSFNAGVDVSAAACAPGPSTVAGAVGSIYGGEPDAVRGPVAAVRDPSGALGLRFPAPGDLAVPEAGGLARLSLAPLGPGTTCDLDPAPNPAPAPDLAPDLGLDLGLDPEGLGRGEGVQGSIGAGPAAAGGGESAGTGSVSGLWYLVGEGAQVSGWVDEVFLAGYLDAREGLQPGGWLEPGDPFAALAGAPWQAEGRLGLARTEAGTAREGFLYQAEHLRFVDGGCLLAQVVNPPGPVKRAVVAVGGESRLADAGVVPAVQLPDHPEVFPGGRVAVYLATAAVFPGGWCWHPPGARLAGAAVAGVLPVATASPRRGRQKTRALRWAVPAGSVFFLEFGQPHTAAGTAAGTAGAGAGRAGEGEGDSADAAAARAALTWVRDHHGKCLPGQACDRDGRDRLRSAGYGLALMGRW